MPLLLLLAALACRQEESRTPSAPPIPPRSGQAPRAESTVEASSGPIRIRLELLATTVKLRKHRVGDEDVTRVAAANFRATLTNVGKERIYPPAGFFASPNERPSNYGVYLEVTAPNGRRLDPLHDSFGHPDLTPEGKEELERFARGLIEAVQSARRLGQDEDEAKVRYTSEYHKRNHSPRPEPPSLAPGESFTVDSWSPAAFATSPVAGFAQMPFALWRKGHYRVRLVYDATLAKKTRIAGLPLPPEAVRAATPEIIVTVE